MGYVVTSNGDQHDRETVETLMSMTARDLEGPVGGVREAFFQLVRCLRVAETIAEQDHPGFDVSGSPRVQEMVSGSERMHVTRLGGILLLGGMTVRSSPDWGRQKEKICC
jgi:hypothetical protein